MIPEADSLLNLVEIMMRKAPEYFDLLTAKSEAEFELAFDTLLGKAVSNLEQNSKNFASLDEVGLTADLAHSLSMPGLSVTQEAHSNGHVDLTIEADHCVPARRKLGEAKIYNGPEYHVQGLGQLLKRYTTGREGRGLLIVYVRKQNISGLMKKIREKMDAEHPCQQQGDTVDHALKWSFLSSHAHSCGDHLDVSHVGCNLYNDPSA